MEKFLPCQSISDEYLVLFTSTFVSSRLQTPLCLPFIATLVKTILYIILPRLSALPSGEGVLTHPCFQRRRFPVPRYAKRPEVALLVIDSFLLLPPRPVITAPPRFSIAIGFGNRPPLIQMSASAHKRFVVSTDMSQRYHIQLYREHGYRGSSSGLVFCDVPR